MHHWWYGYGDGHLGWMGAWWLLGAGVLAIVVWALVTTLTRAPVARSPDSPETILKRRYAKGEIDRDTFRRMLGDLGSSGGPGGPLPES